MEITIEGTERQNWVKIASDIIPNSFLTSKLKEEEVRFFFRNISSVTQLEPFHFVLLACIRQQLKVLGFDNCKIYCNETIRNYLLNEINLGAYWIGESPIDHSQSNDKQIFNLWRVKSENIEGYSEAIHQYLKRNFFKNKDLSSVKNALIEIFQNIFDHADANGNAFSFIRYNEKEEKIYIAVCDFGKGIANTIREVYPDLIDDKSAIEKATKDTISARSKDHNRGLGLGNVIANLTHDDHFRIVSNNGLMKISNNKTELFDLSFEFSGTLIYFDISMSQFEEEEIQDTFNW